MSPKLAEQQAGNANVNNVAIGAPEYRSVKFRADPENSAIEPTTTSHLMRIMYMI